MARPSNRRRERRHVLDVKLSSNQVRRRRSQLALSALLSLLLLGGAGYGLWRGGWWAVQRFIYQNEQLQVREFLVATDGVINPEVLRRWAGVRAGDNLFAINLHDIKRQIEMHDMVRQASLERLLPDRLRLRVTERVPLARVRVLLADAAGRPQSAEYGLDQSGYVMQLDPGIVRAETARLWRSLPELASLTQPELRPGTTLTNRSARAALQFVAAYNASPMRSLFPATAIAVTGLETFDVRGPAGRSVEVLDRDFERQLARWEAAHRACESNRVSYEWIGLSHTNNVPIRLIPLVATTAPPARHP